MFAWKWSEDFLDKSLNRFGYYKIENGTVSLQSLYYWRSWNFQASDWNDALQRDITNFVCTNSIILNSEEKSDTYITSALVLFTCNSAWASDMETKINESTLSKLIISPNSYLFS